MFPFMFTFIEFSYSQKRRGNYAKRKDEVFLALGKRVRRKNGTGVGVQEKKNRNGGDTG